MRIGLALPQFDFSVPGESFLRWDTIAEHVASGKCRIAHGVAPLTAAHPGLDIGALPMCASDIRLLPVRDYSP